MIVANLLCVLVVQKVADVQVTSASMSLRYRLASSVNGGASNIISMRLARYCLARYSLYIREEYMKLASEEWEECWYAHRV